MDTRGKSLTGEWPHGLTSARCPNHSGPCVCSVKCAQTYSTLRASAGEGKAKARLGMKTKWHVWPTLPPVPRAGIADPILAFLAPELGPAPQPFSVRDGGGRHRSITASECEKSDMLSPHWRICLFCFRLKAAAARVVERALAGESGDLDNHGCPAVSLGQDPRPLRVSSKSLPAPRPWTNKIKGSER